MIFQVFWLIVLALLVYYFRFVVVWIWSTAEEAIMGSGSSRSSRRTRSVSSSYGSHSSNHHGYPPASPHPSQPGYMPQTPYTPHHAHYAPSAAPHSYSAPPPVNNVRSNKRLERKYSRIADNYRTLDEVRSCAMAFTL